MTEAASAPEPLPPIKSVARRVVDDLRRRTKSILSDRKRRPFYIAGAALGAVLVALLVWLLFRPPEIAVLEIRPSSVEVVLSVVARVRPDNLVDVRSPNAGQIIRLLHDDGDIVALGAPLAIVRSTVEQAQTDAGSARVAAARAEVTRARIWRRKR